MKKKKRNRKRMPLVIFWLRNNRKSIQKVTFFRLFVSFALPAIDKQKQSSKSKISVNSMISSSNLSIQFRSIESLASNLTSILIRIQKRYWRCLISLHSPLKFEQLQSSICCHLFVRMDFSSITPWKSIKINAFSNIR